MKSKTIKSILFASLPIVVVPSLSAADLVKGYTTGLLSPNGETLFEDNAAAGGGDAEAATGFLPWVAEIKGLWFPGDEVSLTGFAFAMPAPFTASGTMTFTFYGLGENNVYDGAASETNHGSATATLTFDGAGVYYVNFDTPVNFTAGSTGIAVHLQNSAALRVKVSAAASAPNVVRRNRTTGALSGGANPNFRMSLAGTVVAAPSLAWHGGVSNVWDTTTLNWNEGNSLFTNGLRTLFDDTAVSISPATIELTSAHEPSILDVNNSSIDYTFTGSPISGSGSLIKQGTGILTLSTTNAYTGGTTVAGGKLIADTNDALGTGPLALAGGTFHGSGTTGLEISNPVVVTADSTLGDSVENGALNFTGPVDFGGGARNLTFLSPVTMSGNLSNGSLITKFGLGTLTLTGTGTQTVGNLQIARGNVVLDGANITRTVGGARIASQIPGGTARLLLTNGAVLTTVGGANVRVGSDSDFVGNNSANNILGVSGAGTQLIVGTAVQMGAASATATVNITDGGRIVATRISSNGGAVKTLNVDNGTLAANASVTNFIQGLNAANVLAGGMTIDSSGFDITAAQPFTGVGDLTKSGLGTLTLAGANDYAGVTTVTGGNLRVEGDQTAASGDVEVATGAGFGGSGIVGGNVTFQSGATALFTKAPAADSPLLLLGNVTFSNTAVTVDVPGTSRLGNGSFVLATINGTLAGSLQTTPQITGAGLGTGGTAVVSITGNQVNLVVSGAVLNPYEIWSGSGGFQLTGGKFDDDDNDGVPNFLEFALAGDPTDATDNGTVATLLQDATAPAGNELTLVAAVRRGAVFSSDPGASKSNPIDGVVYTIEGSTELLDFTADVTPVGSSDTAVGLPSLAGSEWEYHTFSLDVSEGLTGKGFMRVAVTEAP